jgi:SAP domain
MSTAEDIELEDKRRRKRGEDEGEEEEVRKRRKIVNGNGTIDNADVSMDPSNMSYRELQQACKKVGLPANLKKEMLLQALREYLKDPIAAKQKIEATKVKDKLKKEEEKKKRRAGWIDWKNSAAREILMEDILPDGWLYGKEEDAKIVFDLYQQRQPEFAKVPFSQFEVRYNDAIKKAEKRRARSAQEEEWMKHDRRLHPRQTLNHRGEPVFDMDVKAKETLREDVKNKLYGILKPRELWELRKVYQKYDPNIFRQRIYQEIRRNKYLNYLEKKRTKKRRIFEAEKEGQDVNFSRKKQSKS